MTRIELIKKLVCKVQNKPVKLADIERQAVFLADQEYVKTNKKVVDNVSELDFN